jgi:hypothetical protein
VAAQAEFSDPALAVLEYLEDDPSESRPDFALGPMISAGAGKVQFDLIDLKPWRDRARLHRAAQQPPGLLDPAPVKVPQPSVRHRGPRRGHVGARRRSATRRVTASSRAGPRSDDPHQGDDDDEHRRTLGGGPA